MVILINLAWMTAETAGEILGNAGMTIFIGLVVVFFVLILLTTVFKLFGVIMSAAQKKPSVAEITPSAPPVQPKASAPSAPVVQEGIPNEVVAAIAAAVTATAEEGQTPVVRQIRRFPENVPSGNVWAAAGRFENTRAF